MFINGTADSGALGTPNTGGAGGTVVLFSGDASSDSTDYNGGTVILVNGSASSIEAP